MPIYEYRCTECGHQFEVQQRFSDAPLEACPNCQGKLRKVFHPAGVIFKGSGFYTTDYKGAGKSSGKSSGNGSGNGSSGENKTERSDSKPESKSDSAD